MAHEEIILASGSPRRRELLTELGVRFEVVTAEVTEVDAVSAPGFSPTEIALENARRKAHAVARSMANRWVLGADTVVALEGRLLGKPASLGEAQEFLRALSGRTHEVITGCSLLRPSGGEYEFFGTTQVTFRALSEEIIAEYLDAVHVLDKAGAYALQERGEWIIEWVEGSRSNVIGLPTELLRDVFVKRGLL